MARHYNGAMGDLFGYENPAEDYGRLVQRVRSRSRSLVRKGVIPREPCMWCGYERVQMHHEMYNDVDAEHFVQWVCRWCHLSWHVFRCKGLSIRNPYVVQLLNFYSRVHTKMFQEWFDEAREVGAEDGWTAVQVCDFHCLRVIDHALLRFKALAAERYKELKLEERSDEDQEERFFCEGEV